MVSQQWNTPPQVRLNARRREDGVLEATALWLEGARPQGYRGSALVCQLDLQAREQRFKVPGCLLHCIS